MTTNGTDQGVAAASQPSLSQRLATLERLEKELLRKPHQLLGRNMTIYSADMFIFGATKRTIAQASAFRSLIEARNFQVAAALVRMQIDTAMRLNGLRIVADRNALCDALLAGTPFNKMKDVSGRPMTDANLRRELEIHHPWIGPIYAATSAFVHLSGRAFYTSIANLDDATRTVSFLISDRDPDKPEEAYFEAVDGFLEITKVASLLVLGYLKARAEAVESGPSTRTTS